MPNMARTIMVPRRQILVALATIAAYVGLIGDGPSAALACEMDCCVDASSCCCPASLDQASLPQAEERELTDKGLIPTSTPTTFGRTPCGCEVQAPPIPAPSERTTPRDRTDPARDRNVPGAVSSYLSLNDSDPILRTFDHDRDRSPSGAPTPLYLRLGRLLI
jgi:hypothetical protein